MDALESVMKYREYCREKKQKELEKQLKEQGITMEEYQRQQNDIKQEQRVDSPYTIEDSTALVFYIITMIGGSIFNDRWIIWIIATIVYFSFRNRHK